MQKDPIGLAGGSANEYSFCANNPVNMVDPIGLKRDSCPDGGSGGRSGRGSGGRGGGSGWWPVNIAGAFLNELNPLNTHGTFYRQANSIERALAFEYDDAARDSTQAILDDQSAPSWARGTHYGALAVSATATAVAAGLMMANVDPWLGRVSIDNAHHGIQSAHFEVIIRGAGKFIKELPFNIQRPIEIF